MVFKSFTEYICLYAIVLLACITYGTLPQASKLFLYDAVCNEEFGKEIFNVSKKASIKCRLGNCSQPPVEFQTCQNLTRAGEEAVQKQAADLLFVVEIIQNVPGICLSLLCGAWSDQIGRKLPMILPLIGDILGSVVYIIVELTNSHAVVGIIVGVVLHSLMGRNAVFYLAVRSYISDVTSIKARTQQIGFATAMKYIGMVIGSLIIGLLGVFRAYSPLFTVTALISIAAISLILLKLEESIEVKKMEKSYHLATSFFHPPNLTDSLQTLWKDRPDNKRRYLILILICTFLHFTCKSGETVIAILFVKASPLNWSNSIFGFWLALHFVANSLFLFLILPFCIHILRISDSVIAIACIVLKGVGYVAFAFSIKTWMAFVATILLSPFGATLACFDSILSKIVGPKEMGRCFGLIMLSETFSDLIGVMVYTRLFQYGISQFSGGKSLPYLVMAGLHVILLCLMMCVYVGMKDDSKDDDQMSLTSYDSKSYSTLKTENKDMESIVKEIDRKQTKPEEASD